MEKKLGSEFCPLKLLHEISVDFSVLIPLSSLTTTSVFQMFHYIYPYISQHNA